MDEQRTIESEQHEGAPRRQEHHVSRRGLLAGAATAGAGALLAGGSARAQDATPGPLAGEAIPGPATPVVATPSAGATGPKFGFVLSHEQFPAPQLVEWGVAAEAAGFDELWVSDHIHPWQDNQGHSMFPWITLALIGARTSTIVMGTGVTCPIYRHSPADVAQAFATLGIFNPGRIFLGVGTGEALNEQAFTGQFGPYAERASRFQEAIQLIRLLWAGDVVNHRGEHFNVEHARLYDVPEQAVPLHVAASGPKSAAIAGKHGDGWITGAADLLKKPELLQAVKDAAQAAGKDPAAFPVRAETFVNVAGGDTVAQAASKWRFTVDAWSDLLYEPDPRDIQAIAEQRFPDEQVTQSWPIGEDPAVHVQAIQKVLDAGATHVYIHSGEEDQQRVIDFNGSQVLPRLRGQM